MNSPSPVTSKRVFDSSSREIGKGTEYAAQIEVLYENGKKSLADALARRFETDEWSSQQATFVIQRFASEQDSSPTGTDVLSFIIDRKKEEVEGDYHWVTSYGIFVSSKGIYRLPAIRAKVPTAIREREFSVEEIMEQSIAMMEQVTAVWGDK